MAAEFCGCILGEFCGVSFSFDFVWLGYMSFIHLAYLKLAYLAMVTEFYQIWL